MIGDGMSDMGGSAPGRDDLDVNVQPIIDAVPDLSIERHDKGCQHPNHPYFPDRCLFGKGVGKAFEYPDPYIGGGQRMEESVGDWKIRTGIDGPPVKPVDDYPMDTVRYMTSETTSLADKPVTIVLDLDAARARRGTTNQNVRGNVADRARRRAWLVETYRADVDAYPEHWTPTALRSVPACRCYRCGMLLTVDTVTVDRIIPGCRGGTYRRNNIRPACSSCNSITGSTTRKR